MNNQVANLGHLLGWQSRQDVEENPRLIENELDVAHPLVSNLHPGSTTGTKQ